MWWSNALSWSVWGINMLEHHRSSAPLWWKSSLKMIHGISYDLLGLLLLGKFSLNGTNERRVVFFLKESTTNSFWENGKTFPQTEKKRDQTHKIWLRPDIPKNHKVHITILPLPFKCWLVSVHLHLIKKNFFFGHLLANKFPAGIWKMMNEIGESVGAQHSHLGKQQFSTFDVFPTSQLDTRGNHYNVLHLVWIHLRGMLYF